MPSKQVAVTLSGTTVFTTPSIMKGTITGFTALAPLVGTSGQMLSLIDSFTPDASNGNSTPTAVTRVLGSWNTVSGTQLVLKDEELRGMVALGTVTAAGAVSGDTVTVGWKLE